MSQVDDALVLTTVTGTSPVPLPAALPLFLSGLAGLAAVGRRGPARLLPRSG